MRILFLTSSAPKAAGDATAPFMLTMAEALQELGHEVTILAPHAPFIAQTESINGVRFIRFRYAWPQRLQCLTASAGGALPQLRRSWYKALLLPCFALGQAIALRRLLRAEHFDVLHTHWLLPQGLIGGLVAKPLGVPHCCMLHGADMFNLHHPLWQWLKKQALTRTKYVIANSSVTATAVRGLHGTIPISIIPVGALTPTDPIIPLADRSGTLQPKLLFVGRLFEGKGLRYLLDAMAQLPRSVQLAVIGDGVDRAALEAQAQQLGLGRRVKFLGALPHAQVLDLMQQAFALVAPSVRTADGWQEAQGNAIIEAMLRGLPIIASLSGGIMDAITHEQTGLLVPEKDSEAIADAVMRLLGDVAAAQAIANAARNFALANATASISAQRIAALYTSFVHPSS